MLQTKVRGSLLQQYWTSRHPYKPMSAAEMAERFKFEFHAGIAIAEELSVPFPEELQRANVGTPLCSLTLFHHNIFWLLLS